MTAEELSRHLENVRHRINNAAARSGRDVSGIRIVAVTKTVGVDTVKAAFAAGIADFGENRWPDAAARVAGVPGAVWHFIGSLQKNKVRKVLAHFRWIHSVDNVELLKAIAARAENRPMLLVEVNVSGEGTKHGVKPEELAPLLQEAAPLDTVEVRGLMTMAPFVPAEQTRPVFRALRELRDDANRRSLYREPLAELSMGMTNDFETAVEEGATMLRIGTAIFGPSD
ncbi:MAG TPA: YggS family pyridoxal phosphate-dependent enzyme [Planctomycetes bacterium]|nr:YggS family pyridoxal phosphate-dependent enzyme [Planctomycetota bacterium]